MTNDQTNPLRYLSATEQDCVRRYVTLLRERLGDNLVEGRLFGLAARGDIWNKPSSSSATLKWAEVHATLRYNDYNYETFFSSQKRHEPCDTQGRPTTGRA